MNLNQEQIDKLKRTWAADRTYDICSTEGTQPYYEELRAFEKETRKEINETERSARHHEIVKAHEPEQVWMVNNDHGRESMKRTRLGAGYLYTHTVMLKTPVTGKDGKTVHVASHLASSMCFVPEAEEYILSEDELTDQFQLTPGAIRGYLHTSKDYANFISKFIIQSETPELYFISLRRLWHSYWGLKL